MIEIAIADPARELDELVPPGMPPEVAVKRLRGVCRSLLIENGQLREALESRIAIEQAKGILAERFELDVDLAFEILRRASRAGRIKLHDLARAAVDARTTPAEITRAVGNRHDDLDAA